MKRFLLFIGLVLSYSLANGQVYTPFIPQPAPLPTYDDLVGRNPFNSNYSTPPQPMVTKLSEEVIVTNTYSFENDCKYVAQIKEEAYSNGEIIQTMVGIKINGVWQSTNIKVNYIANMLSMTNLPKDTREFLLSCSEYATHICSYGNDVLLIGLREQ